MTFTTEARALRKVRHNRGLSTCLLLTAVLVTCSNSSPEVRMPSASEVSRISGCYEIHLGRWWPWYGGESRGATVPSQFELRGTPGTHGFEKDGFLIRPVEEHWQSYWKKLPSGRVRLAWTYGFGGMIVDLDQNHSSDSMSGWARPFTDTPGIIPRYAHARVDRISCSEMSP